MRTPSWGGTGPAYPQSFERSDGLRLEQYVHRGIHLTPPATIGCGLVTAKPPRRWRGLALGSVILGAFVIGAWPGFLKFGWEDPLPSQSVGKLPPRSNLLEGIAEPRYPVFFEHVPVFNKAHDAKALFSTPPRGVFLQEGFLGDRQPYKSRFARGVERAYSSLSFALGDGGIEGHIWQIENEWHSAPINGRLRRRCNEVIDDNGRSLAEVDNLKLNRQAPSDRIILGVHNLIECWLSYFRNHPRTLGGNHVIGVFT